MACPMRRARASGFQALPRIALFTSEVLWKAAPFSPLLFKNIRVFFVGSDDFPAEAKLAAAKALNDALVEGWSGFEISERLPLDEIATAHESMETPRRRGRVVLTL